MALKLPDGMFEKCPNCQRPIYVKSLGKSRRCRTVTIHFGVNLQELAITIDAGTFNEWNSKVKTVNPLDFPDYENKITKTQRS